MLECPKCGERVGRKDLAEKDLRCPRCGHDFGSDDDLDELMLLDFIADGDLDGMF